MAPGCPWLTKCSRPLLRWVLAALAAGLVFAPAGLLYAADQSSLTEQSVRELEEQLSKAHAERTSTDPHWPEQNMLP